MLNETPLRVMALHAMLYCKRLFYLEEVEGIYVADSAVYAGRELHTSLEADEEGEMHSLDVSSEKIGLRGKVDCIRRREGGLIPYEHKRGRCLRRDGEADVWPSDKIQVAAYALLLQEALGENIEEARVRYHADNVCVRVPINQELRELVHETIKEARRIQNKIERPPVTDNERLCVKCSLAPVCLPEEVRYHESNKRKPVRLYPMDDDRKTLHICTPGATIGRRNETLVVRPPKNSQHQTETKYPSREVRSVVLHGFSQISTQALRLCVDQHISIHWTTTTGNYLAGLAVGPGGVHRRIRQYKALSDPVECFRLAKATVHSKIQGQHRYLLRATRTDSDRRTNIQKALNHISHTLGEVSTASNPDELRGLEGSAATQYFSSIDCLLGSNVDNSLRYSKRNRRPPRDRFNAILSFGYSLLHGAVMQAVLAVGLEPSFGFFHRPRSTSHPLVLDVMELFRVSLWDLVVIGSLNRGQWDPNEDFTIAPSKVWLSDAGRRKAITLFENRMEEQWKHPVLDYSLSYARTIELEVRLLEKEWSGEPGLFARSRLR